MPCCRTKKKQYQWCKPFPVVEYKDQEGNEYCVFHAPHGKKGIYPEEFNKTIFDRISQSLENGKIKGTVLFICLRLNVPFCHSSVI